MRRFHNKSRLGCKQCKLRRSKCDEARPSCGRCSQSKQPCSFVTELSVMFLPLPRLSTSHWPSPSHLRATERYGSLDLCLFHHFEHDFYHHEKAFHPGLKDIVGLFVKTALATPYLMAQLLAYAAAHKSTLDRKTSQFYVHEATRLQTRALEQYNRENPRIFGETCLPMFIFSSLTSHHVIFNLSSSVHRGLDAVLEELVCSTVIHRGLIAIAKVSWPMFTEQVQQRFVRSCQRDYRPIPSGPDSKGECDALLRRLNAGAMPPESIDMLCSAVEILQDRFDSICTNSTHAMWAAVQDWLATIPAGYTKLLDRRQPEALVVLAHFAVLLYRVAEHWFVGDLGLRLVCLINTHLGPSWDDWMEWPNRITRA